MGISQQLFGEEGHCPKRALYRQVHYSGMNFLNGSYVTPTLNIILNRIRS